MTAEFYPLKVCDISALAEDACQITFHMAHDLPEIFTCRPGQYLTFRVPQDGGDVLRSFSVCSAPGQPLAIGVRRVGGGAFSDLAFGALAVGDTLWARPPEGRFCLPQIPLSSVLLIAGGSGITPMMAIAQSALANLPDCDVTLIYGNRNSHTIMFHEQLEELKDSHLGRFSCINILSREEQDVPLLNGHIDAGKLATLNRTGAIAPLTSDAIFLCGPGGMIAATRDALTDLGVDPQVIKSETFVAAGQTTPPATHTREQPQVGGVDIDVVLDGRRHSFVMQPDDASLIESAQRAGFELPFSCKGGMCCTCRCRITKGAAEMALNYSLEPWEIAAGFTLACQARPTTGQLALDFDET